MTRPTLARSLPCLVAATLGCTTITTPIEYLGPVDAGCGPSTGGCYEASVPFAPSSNVPSPLKTPQGADPSPLLTSAMSCAATLASSSPPLQAAGGAAVRRTSSASNGDLLLGVEAGLLSLPLDAAGCPKTASLAKALPTDTGPAPSLSSGGALPSQTSPLLWASGGRDTQIFNDTLALQATCPGAFHAIAADPSRPLAFAIAGDDSLHPLTLSAAASGASCALLAARPLSVPLPIDLLDGGAPGGTTSAGTTLAIAPSTQHGGSVWVATEGFGAGDPPQIRLYDSSMGQSQGHALPAPSDLPLCGVQSMIQIGTNLVVADATCAQVVVFDTETLVRKGHLALAPGRLPLLVTSLEASPPRFLLVQAQPTSTGSTLSFVVSPLP